MSVSAQAYIPDMIDRLKKEGYAHIDEGALVIDVKEETDTKEIPPCMIQKSDGASRMAPRILPLWYRENRIIIRILSFMW